MVYIIKRADIEGLMLAPSMDNSIFVPLFYYDILKNSLFEFFFLSLQIQGGRVVNLGANLFEESDGFIKLEGRHRGDPIAERGFIFSFA